MSQKKDIILVVDGQGGGIGKSIVEGLKKELPHVHIRAVGTNSLATGKMMKAGADDGATGENAILVNVPKADIIMGVAAILMSNAMLGEITPKMASIIGSSDAMKIVIPLQKCQLRVAVPKETSLQESIHISIQMAKEYLS